MTIKWIWKLKFQTFISKDKKFMRYNVVYEIETEHFWYLLTFRFFGNYKYYNQYKD